VALKTLRNQVELLVQPYLGTVERLTRSARRIGDHA
jgi:hypothetical protein